MVTANWLIKATPKTGEPTDGIGHENHIWHVDKVKALVANQDEAVTLFCGGSRNFGISIDAAAPVANVVDEILRKAEQVASPNAGAW